MLKIAKQTGLVPEEIMDRASAFFGKGGEHKRMNIFRYYEQTYMPKW